MKTKKQTACRYGDDCKNKNTCMFYHEGYAKQNIQCRYGLRCTRKNCFYLHPGEKLPPNTTTSEKYESDKILMYFVSPEQIPNKPVTNTFESFKDYFTVLVENHLADFYTFYNNQLEECKKRPRIPVRFYQKKFKLFLAIADKYIPSNGFEFTLFHCRNTLCLTMQQPKDSKNKSAGKRYAIYGPQKPSLLNDRRYQITVLGYIGNFSANIVSMANFNENKNDSLKNIKKFLLNPQENFPGDYTTETVPEKEGCNKSQMKACGELKNGVEIIQGPPGTGKSTTITAIIKHRIEADLDNKVLVTTTRNQALESLVEKLEKTDIQILVFGDENKVYPRTKQHLFSLLVQKDEKVIAQNLKLKKMFQERAKLKIKSNTITKERYKINKELVLIKEKIKEEKNKLKAILFSVKQKLFDKSVIFLSTISSINKILKESTTCSRKFKPQSILVDEAGCMEEIAVASILQLGANNLILVGDHKQLPPLVMSDLGGDVDKNMNLSRSLMERIIDCGVEVHLLDTQYRMHRDVMKIVSNLFYKGALKMGDIKRNREKGVVWYNTTEMETVVKNGKEIFNTEEVNLCEEIYKKERNEFPTQTISIIAFYNGQIKLLRERFSVFNDPKLKIQSVDSSQGSEADIVLISCVRNNEQNAIGFLKDSRRVNVAISRAKEVLIITGCHEFYLNSNNANWKYIAENAHLINK